MSKYNLECLVLKSLNYRDADKIYTLYSRDQGKFAALGKGVRKISSTRGANLDTLSHVVIGISDSNRGMKTITEVKGLKSFKFLKGDFELCTRGYYLSELIYRITEDLHENSEIFDLFLDTLNILDLGIPPSNLNALMLWFELGLLRNLGYETDFSKCLNCSRKFDFPEMLLEKFNFNSSLGGIICNNCAPQGANLSGRDVVVLKYLSQISSQKLSSYLKEKNVLVSPFLRRLWQRYLIDTLGSKINTVGIFTT